MNAQRYLNVLQDNLLPNMQAHGCTMFQQDSAPCHTALVVKAWFQQQLVDLLSWPGNSPDINPIENFWQIVKTKSSAIRITSATHLIAEITRVWNYEITTDVCKNLINSMPSRLTQIIKNMGYPIKY